MSVQEMRSENFFQLPDSVVLEEVSSDEELKVLKRKSLSWSCVGLDTESLRGGKCALLQVSTKTTAFLIDLLAVSREQLRDFLVPLMAERAITKLGFGASERDFLTSPLVEEKVKLTLLVSGQGPTSAAGNLQNAVDRGQMLLAAKASSAVPIALQPHVSGKIYAQQAVALDFLAGGLARIGASLSDTAVIICGRYELLRDTPTLLEAACKLRSDPWKSKLDTKARTREGVEEHTHRNL
eukprot:g33746.t1